MTRREFPAKVRIEAFRRSGKHCEKCTAPLYTGKFIYDHVIPDQFGGEPTLSNCQVLCQACDRTKTYGEDIPAIAKAKRREAAHVGARKRNAGFPRRPAQRTATRPIARYQGDVT